MIQLALAMLVHRKARAGFTVLGLAALFPLSGAPRRIGRPLDDRTYPRLSAYVFPAAQAAWSFCLAPAKPRARS
jgi:hypothetical protein